MNLILNLSCTSLFLLLSYWICLLPFESCFHARTSSKLFHFFLKVFLYSYLRFRTLEHWKQSSYLKILCLHPNNFEIVIYVFWFHTLPSAVDLNFHEQLHRWLCIMIDLYSISNLLYLQDLKHFHLLSSLSYLTSCYVWLH